jgi:hypothetical protein
VSRLACGKLRLNAKSELRAYFHEPRGLLKRFRRVHQRIPTNKNSFGFRKMKPPVFNQTENLAFAEIRKPGGGFPRQHFRKSATLFAKSCKTSGGNLGCYRLRSRHRENTINDLDFARRSPLSEFGEDTVVNNA